MLISSPVASERNQHCGGETRPEGSKLEGMSQGGGGFLEEGLNAPFPTSEGVWGMSAVSPRGFLGKALAANSFGAFWVLQVSSPVDLLCVHIGVRFNEFHCAHYAINYA